MSRLHFTISIALGVASVIACDRRDAGRDAPGTSWYEVVRTPEIRALLDTGRVERTSSGTHRVWMRFEYAQPMVLAPDTTRYSATETRQEIDCRGRRTRGLELRMQALGGIAIAVPTPDVQWSSIDTHPLNSGVFLVACRAVGTPIPARAETPSDRSS